jgi:phosphate transport system substrate-binding protein
LSSGIRNKWFVLPFLTFILAILVLAGCSGSAATTQQTTSSTDNPSTSVVQTANTSTAASTTSAVSTAVSTNLLGAGATFPAPLYTKWFDEYNKLTGVKINYQAVGSGTGIQQITAGTVDFGASDGIMTADQIKTAEAAGGPILHIPMTTGSVAVIYNLTGVNSGQLKLTGDILAKIYLKSIKKWNDPAIQALNPGVSLPDASISVAHRGDSSGTTYIFTNYLSKISDDWKTNVGNATSVQWPGDIAGQGNAGVAAQVQQIPNSIGYVELTYALQNKLAWASLKNAAGSYQEPSLTGTSKAAVGITLPDDMKIMITNSSNPDAYPIAGFTWILAYKNQKDEPKGTTLVKMLWWALHDGQQYEQPLHYAPISPDALNKAENQILSINYMGKSLITR